MPPEHLAFVGSITTLPLHTRPEFLCIRVRALLIRRSNPVLSASPLHPDVYVLCALANQLLRSVSVDRDPKKKREVIKKASKELKKGAYSNCRRDYTRLQQATVS